MRLPNTVSSWPATTSATTSANTRTGERDHLWQLTTSPWNCRYGQPRAEARPHTSVTLVSLIWPQWARQVSRNIRSMTAAEPPLPSPGLEARGLTVLTRCPGGPVTSLVHSRNELVDPRQELRVSGGGTSTASRSARRPWVSAREELRICLATSRSSKSNGLPTE